MRPEASLIFTMPATAPCLFFASTGSLALSVKFARTDSSMFAIVGHCSVILRATPISAIISSPAEAAKAKEMRIPTRMALVRRTSPGDSARGRPYGSVPPPTGFELFAR